MAFQNAALDLTTSDQEAFVVLATLQGAVLVAVANKTGASVNYTLKFYDASLAATTTFGPIAVAANAAEKFPIALAVNAGDKIILSASANDALSAFVTVTESAAAPVAKGFTPRGTWSNATTYEVNDVVVLGGSSYVSLADDNLDNDPTASPSAWALYAAKGDRGADGQVSGPGSSTAGNLAIFNSDDGNSLADSGTLVSDVIVASDIGEIVQPYDAATAKTDVAQSYSAQQSSTLASLVDGANISWSVTNAQKAKVTLGGNRTMNAVTGAVEGATYFLWVIQDGGGSRTLSWTTSGAGSFDFGADGAPTLTTAANRADLLCFEAIGIGGTLKLRYCGIRRGFA